MAEADRKPHVGRVRLRVAWRWPSCASAAWWLWLMIHIARVIGFRNRVQVRVRWTWSYFT